MNSQAKRPVVLIVEPAPGALCRSTEVFEDAGFDVVAAYDAAGALRTFQHGEPDLVVIDATMSGLGSRELIQKLRAEKAHANIPVVGVKANPEDPGLCDNADFYINWPIRAGDLGVLRTLARLRSAELVAYKRARRTPPGPSAGKRHGYRRSELHRTGQTILSAGCSSWTIMRTRWTFSRRRYSAKGTLSSWRGTGSGR
jgi:CheY-like chemotaxis protein